MNIVECSFYVGHTNQGRNKACESNVSIGNIWHESKDISWLTKKAWQTVFVLQISFCKFISLVELQTYKIGYKV